MKRYREKRIVVRPSNKIELESVGKYLSYNGWESEMEKDKSRYWTTFKIQE